MHGKAQRVTTSSGTTAARKVHTVGIIMNGVTGRMGTNQHLHRSIVAIREQGGVKLASGEVIMPAPVLVGRNAEKLQSLAAAAGGVRWTTDLDEALGDSANSIYFDAQATDRRAAAVRRAIAAGKHVYCEKPTANSTAEAYELYALAKKAGVKHGVVQDKLWLPGMLKLAELHARGFFGRILSVRGEFGYWVFEGDTVPAQRPSWNYRKEDGGGIIMDMLCHWRYVLDHLFGSVKAVSCTSATHIPTRWDESGKPYECTAEDSAYATFELEGGVIAQINSSWCVRVRRDDLLTLQVDGTRGSAVAGLRDCWTQSYGETPRPTWNPDIPSPIAYFDGWQKFAGAAENYENAFKAEWELFLRHVVAGEPFAWTLLEGAKGVQLGELGLQSAAGHTRLEVPELRP
jgi:predicted dehydrogenase